MALVRRVLNPIRNLFLQEAESVETSVEDLDGNHVKIISVRGGHRTEVVAAVFPEEELREDITEDQESRESDVQLAERVGIND